MSPERIVLITGAAQGIGAEAAARLASADTHVIVNFSEHGQDADAVARTIRDAGGHASTLAADISDETETTAMVDAISARFGRLDRLILNASGTRDAQRRLTRLALPLMPAGGRIVFVTSHQAHFYPYKAVPKGYAAVAASKRADEAALHAARAEFQRARVQFTVVSGDMIEGAHATGAEFASAIVKAATTAHPASIVYVGGADYLMTAA